MTRSAFAPSLLLSTSLLLAGCVASPLYVGEPGSRGASISEPGYSGLIRDGVAHRNADRGLTTGSEVPRDALGNLIMSSAVSQHVRPRHPRKHWFGL